VAVEEIGLIDAAEVAVEMSDAGVVGSFEVEDHRAARPFADELVKEKMVCFGCPAGGQGSRVQQVEPVGVPEEYGGAKGL